jgi:hypothetical protein
VSQVGHLYLFIYFYYYSILGAFILSLCLIEQGATQAQLDITKSYGTSQKEQRLFNQKLTESP